MRILYFSRDYTTHDRRFLHALSNSPHEVFYLRLENDGNPYEKNSLPESIQWIEWDGGQNPHKTPEDWLKLIPAYEQVIETYKPGIIQAGPVQSCGWMTAITGFHPYVLVSWGYDMLLDSDKSAVYKWMTKYALQHADYFLCDSDAVLSKTKPFTTFQPHQVIQFPWGIELERFEDIHTNQTIRQKLGWQENFILISTRTWEPIYGIEVMLKAFHKAYSTNPNIRLIMLGSGSLADDVMNYIQNNQLQDVIYTPGFVATKDIVDYFINSDLYISCTYCDGASISLLEAMVCGLPVLVTNAFGNLEWVTENVNGWLAKPGNDEEYAQKITTAVNQPKSSIEVMKNNNRNTVYNRANWDKNIQNLLQFYNKY